MITRVQVKNYRSLADVDVALGPLTILVGRNGAGKSTFLDVLRFVRDALRHGLEDAIVARHGTPSLRRWSPRKPYNVEIGLTVETSSFWGEYSFVIASGQRGNYRVQREVCCVGREQSIVEDKFETKGGKWITLPQGRFAETSVRSERPIESTTLVLPTLGLFSPLFTLMRRHLGGNFYNIIPNVLREPQKPSTEKILTDHGENFSSIARLLPGRNKRFPDMLRSLSRVVDGVTDMRVREVGGYLVTELKHNELRDQKANNENSPWFELALESDGTLRMLGMLVALYQYQPPSPIRIRSPLLALEEPENALHPGALAVLSDVLHESSRRHQLLITTQSPDLISRFNVDEIRVVERVAGITHIDPVDEIQRETIKEELFSAGDLLRIEGLRREPANGAGGARA
jgi:predicted ATPase